MRSLVFLLLGWISIADAVPATASQIAVSLKVARTELAGGAARLAPPALAGMTRLLGAVDDPQNQDVILVGEARPGEQPLTLDDLAVMLRACVRGGCAPLVSIDALPDTARTRLQKVRFEGGVGRTAIGQTMLEADVALKMLALGKSPRVPPGYRSYFDLIAEKAQTNLSIASRFWFFVPEGAAAAMGPESIALLELPVGVRTQMAISAGLAAAPQDRDEAGELFVGGLNSNLEWLAAQPEIGRLQVLMGLAIVAQHLGQFRSRAVLDYWIEKYTPRTVDTAEFYKVVERSERIQGKEGAIELRLEGGIDLRVAVRGLQEGSAEMFRKVVLASRPSTATLTWAIALDRWPGVQPSAPLSEQGERRLREGLGTTISGTSTPWGRPQASPPSVPSQPTVPVQVLPGRLAPQPQPGGVKIRFDDMVKKPGVPEGADKAIGGRPPGDDLFWKPKK